MKVRFYADDLESGIYDVPDDITEDELYDMAYEWVSNNIVGFYRIVGGSRGNEDEEWN